MTQEDIIKKINLTQKEMSIGYFLIFISSAAPFILALIFPYCLYKVFALHKLRSVVQKTNDSLCINEISLYKSHIVFMLATQFYFLISVGILSQILTLNFSFKVFGLILFFLFAYLFVSRIINGIDAIYKKQIIEKPLNVFHYLSVYSPKIEGPNR